MVSQRELLPYTSSVLSSTAREQYGAGLRFFNLVRNAGKVTSLASATLIVTTTMGTLGLSPSLEELKERRKSEPRPL